MSNPDYKTGNGRVLGGLFLLGIGAVLFLKQLNFPMPYWLFRWPVMLIIIGLFIGLRHGFRGPGWIILIIIGSIFLIDSINPDYALRKFTAPAVIIAVGIVMILRPKRVRNRDYYYDNRDNGNQGELQEQPAYQQTFDSSSKAGTHSSKEDYIDSVAVFGSVSKVVVSKNFRGGDMVSIFGGNEVDLSQADINGTVIMEVTQIMGGTKMIIPSHWDVESEMVAFFGGIEDKRRLQPGTSNPDKCLILKGTSIFGGIEIRNY